MGAAKNPTAELKDARRRAQQILADLKDIISETELIRRSKYRFHYAIDSSEVYAYLFPMEDDGILSDIFSDSRIENFAYSDYCLHKIISKRRLNRAITRFHANEIHGLYERHFGDLAKLDSLQGFGELEKRAKNELSQFSTNDREQVLHINADGNKEVVPDDQLLATMRAIAPNIYVILMEQATSRSQRKELVSELLKSHDAISPNVQANFNKMCYSYFIEILNRLRPGRIHQNMTDAATLEAIISYNQTKKANYEFVRLVSRDRSIYRAYNFFVRDGCYEKYYDAPNNVNIHVVRHPRTFIWANDRHILAGANARKILELRESLESFITDALETVDEEYESDVTWTSWAVSSLNRNFQELNSKIFDLINSSLTRDIMGESVVETYRSELLILLKKLYKGKSLDSELQKIGKKITQDLLTAHDEIMFLSSSTSTPALRGAWEKNKSTNQVTIRYDLPFFPYDFHFRDVFFKKHVERPAPGNPLEDNETEEFLAEHGLLLGYIYKQSTEPTSACEKRMAMALQQAVRGDWEGAIYYSRVATTVPVVRGLERNEAHYLHSIVLRRNSKNLASLKEAIDSAKKSVGRTQSTNCDPRYLRELSASMLAYLLEKFRADGPIVLEDEKEESQAFHFLEQAIQNYGEDHLGVANCLRIGCSYFLDGRGRRDATLAGDYSERLKIHLEIHDFDIGNMSFRFCDTLLAVFKSRQWKMPFEQEALDLMSKVDSRLTSEKDLEVFRSRKFYPPEILDKFGLH